MKTSNRKIKAINASTDVIESFYFNSIKEAAEAIGGNFRKIQDCAAGRIKSYKGFVFEYADKNNG